MRIMICGSMTFASEIKDTKKRLESLGHVVFIPPDTELHVKDPGLVDNLDSNHKHALENDIMRKSFNLVAQVDAILVLNHLKNDVSGYIGTSSLMEIGLAYYLKKKIFLLNKIPNPQDARWAHEISIMKAVIIDGDLSKVE